MQSVDHSNAGGFFKTLASDAVPPGIRFSKTFEQVASGSQGFAVEPVARFHLYRPCIAKSKLGTDVSVEDARSGSSGVVSQSRRASRHENVGFVRLLRTNGDQADWARMDVSRRSGLRSRLSVEVQGGL